MQMFAGTPAGAKAGKIYADEIMPKANITEEDFMPTAQPMAGPTPAVGAETVTLPNVEPAGGKVKTPRV